MERYVKQLLEDIAHATANLSWPYADQPVELFQWQSDEEEERTSPRRDLERWTGIEAVMLPPADKLSPPQISAVLEALKKLLIACNWSFVIQIEVPEAIQYETIRQNFAQEVIVKRWRDGFFKYCEPNTERKTCTFGEYCQCAFFDEFFAGFEDKELTEEEDRRMRLEIEIKNLKRKHGSDWMRYYPYHLDPDYDSDDSGDVEDEDEDNWWRS